MLHKIAISNAEKVISIISYFSMGIAGFIWIILAYLLKKRLKYFLMYNILQSMLISILLAILNLLVRIVLQILLAIPFLTSIGININMFLQRRLQIFGLSFNKIETIVFFLFIYLSLGIILGRIFHVPFLTKFMKKIMISYK